MTSYNAVGVVDIAPTERRSAVWVDALAAYHPAVGRTDEGRAELIITLEASFLDVAAALALQVLTRAAGQLFAFEVLPTVEFDRRVEAMDTASSRVEVYGTTAAAEFLGVTRQRMQQLAADNAVPWMQVGRSLGFLKSDLEKFAASRGRGQHGPTADYGDPDE